MERNYVDGKLHGKELQYFEGGELKAIEYYLAGEEVSRKKWNLVLNEKHEFLQCLFLREELYGNYFSRIEIINELKELLNLGLLD